MLLLECIYLCSWPGGKYNLRAPLILPYPFSSSALEKKLSTFSKYILMIHPHAIFLCSVFSIDGTVFYVVQRVLGGSF